MSTKPTDTANVTVAVGVVIGLAILVAVLIVAMVIMVMIIYKLHCIQLTGYLDPKSLKINEDALPSIVRAQMVSVNSESTGLTRQANDGDEKNSQPQSDYCFTRNQQTIVGRPQENSCCSSREYDVVVEPLKHSPLTAKYSTPSEYSGLVHFKSDNLSVTNLSPLNQENYDHLQFQSHEYEEVFLNDHISSKSESTCQDYESCIPAAKFV
ncbi:uncharacterized protein [Dysidea avara]|uniref:uncharacterized protein n=1 Tax=Dysidea avara TaxID=196820 RepID=UPI00331BBD5D